MGMEEKTAMLPVELNQVYKEAMRKNLTALMNAQDMSQGKLLEKLRQQGLDVGQGSLSQYLSGKKSIPLSVIVHLCSIFRVSLEELVDADLGQEQQPAPQMPQIYSDDLMNFVPSLGDSFITDPASPEFHGYLQTYHFYMLPTQSSKPGMLTGTITLRPCGNVCEARLELEAGTGPDGAPLCRHYDGRVIIAKSIDAVYILLTNPIEGDLTVISFGHYHLSQKPLDCRIAAVLTNESSEFHSPTMHRMFLSRTPIQPEHLDMLRPHLQLNNSSIVIPKKELDALRAEVPEYGPLLDFLAILPPEQTYYWSEDYVLGPAKHILPTEQIPGFLNRIRRISCHCTFNKASRRANYLAQKLLLSLGYYRDI